MGIRVVRHLTGREVNEDNAKLLVAIPYGAGERLRHVRMDAFAATQATSPVDQPSEINWLAVDVPWSILFTHSTSGYQGGTSNLNSAAGWDTIFRNLALEYGTDGNEYYGGDFDATTPDVPPTPGEGAESDDDPIMSKSMGPSGLVRLFGREVLMRPLLAEGAGEIRYFDEFHTTVEGKAVRTEGGCLLIGCVRYSVVGETNFGVEWSTETAKALGPLVGGDSQRVQELIQSNTGSIGDRLRTILFGGDLFIETDTIQALNAKVGIKVWASVETPYRMGVV